MANTTEIQCINKDDRMNPYERIINIGGSVPTQWKITQKYAIDLIEQQGWEFFVMQGRNKVKVIVSVSRFRNKYLKTEADGDEPNNLLSLPECPP